MERTSVSPADGAVIVDLSVADQTFSPVLRGVSIGTPGDLKVTLVGPTGAGPVIIPANCLAAGVQHGMAIKIIHKVGTTAAEIIGWY